MVGRSFSVANLTEMGCCSFFGLLKKHRRPLRPLPASDSRYSPEFMLAGNMNEMDGSFYNCEAGILHGCDSESQKRSKASEAILLCRVQGGLIICREVPVKETRHVTRSEDESGNKMVNEYVRECRIGSGSYGKVVLYKSTTDGKDYAIKAFHKSHLLKLRVCPSETAMTDVLRENIVRGDIKPDNLLVTSSGTVKIGDFSVSHVFEDKKDELQRSPGTPVFTAPECCLGLTYQGRAADTWAVGVTLYCMLLGRYPFLGDTLQETYDKIVNTALPILEGINEQLRNLLEGLLCKAPEQRMSLASVAVHQWVVEEDGPIPEYLCRCKRRSSQRGDTAQVAKDANNTRNSTDATSTIQGA